MENACETTPPTRPDWPGADRRPSSRIRRVVKQHATVYEKQYLPDDWGATETIVRLRARRELDLIQQISQSNLFGAELGIVQVESSDTHEAKITTFEIPGESLDHWIHNRKAKRSRSLCVAMNWAGQWIQRFQKLPVHTESPARFSELDPQSIHDYCELRLDSLQNDYGYRWPSESIRARILTLLESLEEQSDVDRGEPVWVHADYAPGNVMWDGNALTPIDFAMARPGHRLEDVTYFIHRLEMQRIYRPWRNWPLAEWRTSFLEGYGDAEAPHSSTYRLFMIKHLICRLHTYVRRPARNQKQVLHDRWVRGILRRRLEAWSN